ncbi:hypothetical protein ACVIHI_004056 [Bradyrhizobium sp. USDA 4524]|nr:hypothetical protein [Bradyrhizobium sp. USDA 4538]MCP1903590.1 hypothetical protein [Bradyrhizobium sp. USDA 4537]MCP1990753.1 hypothetical protein [Bradyrhizobium sp. USDA 4539]
MRKTYSAPTTPHQRLAADARTPDAVRAQLQEIYAALDPVALLRDIRGAQEGLAALADTQPIVNPVGYRNRLISFWQVYEPPGRTELCDRRIGQSRKRREVGAVPTRSSGQRQICENGLKSNLGGLAANCSPGCRWNILEPIRTSFFERFNVDLNPGAASK